MLLLGKCTNMFPTQRDNETSKYSDINITCAVNVYIVTM